MTKLPILSLLFLLSFVVSCSENVENQRTSSNDNLALDPDFEHGFDLEGNDCGSCHDGFSGPQLPTNEFTGQLEGIHNDSLQFYEVQHDQGYEYFKLTRSVYYTGRGVDVDRCGSERNIIDNFPFFEHHEVCVLKRNGEETTEITEHVASNLPNLEDITFTLGELGLKKEDITLKDVTITRTLYCGESNRENLDREDKAFCENNAPLGLLPNGKRNPACDDNLEDCETTVNRTTRSTAPTVVFNNRMYAVEGCMRVFDSIPNGSTNIKCNYTKEFELMIDNQVAVTSNSKAGMIKAAVGKFIEWVALLATIPFGSEYFIAALLLEDVANGVIQRQTMEEIVIKVASDLALSAEFFANPVIFVAQIAYSAIVAVQDFVDNCDSENASFSYEGTCADAFQNAMENAILLGVSMKGGLTEKPAEALRKVTESSVVDEFPEETIPLLERVTEKLNDAEEEGTHNEEGGMCLTGGLALTCASETKSKMVEHGKSILRYLRNNPDISSENMTNSDYIGRLYDAANETSNDVSHSFFEVGDQDIFSPEEGSIEDIRLKFLSVIASTQWSLAELRLNTRPYVGGIYERGPGTFHGEEYLGKLYLRYFSFENNLALDFTKPLNELMFEVETLDQVFSTGGNGKGSWSKFAYTRNGPGMSSHLRQKDLMNVYKIGIDMRLSKNQNALPVLPNGNRTVHVGLFQFIEGGQTITYFKEEPWGLSTARDALAHGREFIHHFFSGKASWGPRETKTPIDRLNELFVDLENHGYSDSDLKDKIPTLNSKKGSIFNYLQELSDSFVSKTSDGRYVYSEDKQLILQDVLKRHFDVIEVIGNEYTISASHMEVYLTSDVYSGPRF